MMDFFLRPEKIMKGGGQAEIAWERQLMHKTRSGFKA
jgi:hypothetical protein